MCRFASFKFQPIKSMPIRVNGSMDSHHEIPGDDTTNRNGWREGHYLPSGEIECRALETDTLTGEESAEIITSGFPSFATFFAWALTETNQEKEWGGDLYLSNRRQ